MDIYFVKRETITILQTHDIEADEVDVSLLKLLDQEIPEDKYIGDICKFRLNNNQGGPWYFGKIVWHDFNLTKFNLHRNIKLKLNQFKSKYYIFTPFEDEPDQINNAINSLNKFARTNSIDTEGCLVIYSIASDQLDSESQIVIDLFIPINGNIPPKLLKQHQPQQIRRRKYNFYTY
ncbi:MAG: hypothetical protein ACW99A_01405 [Candidatus Kariarchaeaceae archaeon]|jgi:hypothetical protein